MIETIDQLGNRLTFLHKPNRIVCLVPSITEFLYSLNLKQAIVGQTIFCIYPKTEFKAAIKIGGTKKIHIQKIFDLKPDIVIANKEENDKDQILTLQKSLNVWVSNVNSLKTAIDMMQKLAILFERKQEFVTLNKTIITNWKQCKNLKNETYIYLIWQNPYMAIGKKTYIESVLKNVGLTNLVKQTRYPILTSEDIVKLNPNYIFLSSEPFPFKQKHINTLQQICPTAKVKLINGEICSWYGTKMTKMHAYFNSFFKE